MSIKDRIKSRKVYTDVYVTTDGKDFDKLESAIEAQAELEKKELELDWSYTETDNYYGDRDWLKFSIPCIGLTYVIQKPCGINSHHSMEGVYYYFIEVNKVRGSTNLCGPFESLPILEKYIKDGVIDLTKVIFKSIGV